MPTNTQQWNLCTQAHLHSLIRSHSQSHTQSHRLCVRACECFFFAHRSIKVCIHANINSARQTQCQTFTCAPPLSRILVFCCCRIFISNNISNSKFSAISSRIRKCSLRAFKLAFGNCSSSFSMRCHNIGVSFFTQFCIHKPIHTAHTHILHSYIDCRRCRAHYTFFQYARKKTILDCTHSPIYHLCVCGHSLCFRSFCCLVEIINKFDKCIAKTISTAADYYLLLWIAYSSLETHTQCI